MTYRSSVNNILGVVDFRLPIADLVLAFWSLVFVLLIELDFRKECDNPERTLKPKDQKPNIKSAIGNRKSAIPKNP
jgi:hypothetical protein